MCAKTLTTTPGPEIIGPKLDQEITKGTILMATDNLAELQLMELPSTNVGTVGNLITIPPTVDMATPSNATSAISWATKAKFCGRH